MLNLTPEEKIIVAIDGLSMNETITFLRSCPRIKWVKVGLELFSREGPDVIKVLKKMDKKIFLDLKFHDIPNTMRSACYHVSKLGVDIISLHASAGSRALKLSKEATLKGAIEQGIKPPSVIGITVLTSFSLKEFNDELNIETSIEDNVSKLAELCFNSGLDGCVCSPCEVENLRFKYDRNFQLITPGIRLDNLANQDQNRVMTPYQALSKGASKLVIGRPITTSSSPHKVFLDICKTIN